MKNTYNYLRIRQLTRSLEPILNARGMKRPTKGWLSAMREISGTTLRELASRLNVSFQTVAASEKAEANDRITLKGLRETADALGCELIYALVPKKGTVQDFAEAKTYHRIKERVSAVEHSMTLEAQQTGNVEEKVREEVARTLKHGR
ncbi:MAG TPA: transcriptional regulator [Verrucomicrobiae bacterium]|jgi:predicted DNA-binding mobile mystery protein A